MPPTIQNSTNPPEKRPVKPAEKKSELICRVKYCNTLPDIPFDLKFISYPFESSRFIQYNPTSLERNYRYEVLTEHDLGVNIDLINKDVYAVEPGACLDPADEKLLEEDILTPQDSKRSRHHARSVSWLRRTEYISTEQTRFQPQTMDKVEAKVGYSIKKNLKNETLYMDRDSQIKAIEKTFEDSKIAIEKHYSKPNVVPIEVLPIYPDFKLWKYPCAQVIFDSDPAPTGKQVPSQIEEMSQAMIRGVMDESGEQFVAYFLPTEETLQKRREDFTKGIPYQDDEDYEYKMAREYNWNVKSKASKGYEENYFLVIRQDGVYYDELETRVRLSKRRQKPGQQTSNTRLVVKHRPMDAGEFRMQRYREKQLEPAGDDDDEMEMEQEQADDDEQMDQQNNESQAESDQEKQDNEGNETAHESENEKSSGDEESRASSRSSNRSAKSASKSPSRSKSRSASRSRSTSRSKSRSKSKSASRSRSPSGSRSRSQSRSRSRSKSKSQSRSRSPSRSKSRSRSGSRSGSGSASGSGSESGGRSDSE
ncbi:RNA polymerase II-associated factor 1 homolog [Photinus pyralis]|uniref:RNA polymerase II-associated factor 1 homolog n=1 Tax=Photinus pyralis TaxID=7054 RepID=UPI0012672315|nr:RNA polymerase II-associated factor 1 homolog [Photinus pyralis]